MTRDEGPAGDAAGGTGDPLSGPPERVRRRRLHLVVGGLALVLVASGVLGAWHRRTHETDPLAEDAVQGCADAAKATIAVTPALEPTLASVLDDLGCTSLTVRAVSPGEVARTTVTGQDVPDYWIPDSPVWLEQLNAQLASQSDPGPEVVLESVATSPVVVASAPGTRSPRSWRRVLTDPELLLGDPFADASASAPLLLSPGGDDPEQLVATLGVAARRVAGSAAVPPGAAARLARVSDQPGSVTTVSEQAALASGLDLRLGAPRPGTWMLTYPFALTAGADRRADLAPTTLLLTDLLGSSEVREALVAAGFRTPEAVPVEGGVGRVHAVPEPTAADLASVLGAWSRLTVPSNTLVVVDVSGTMDVESTSGTRIGLTVSATTDGLGLFPDGSQVGLWAFSQRLGKHTDYRKVVPLRRLDARVGPRTQRDVLTHALARLPRLTGGSTALYDTAVAAYRHLRAHYDPEAVNTVLLFSDGADADAGSPSLRQTLATLRALGDPHRPVSIIAIGIGQDADADALAKLAEATGGYSMVADRPEDLPALFARAMALRLQSR